IQRCEEKVIDNGFCAFEFVCNPLELFQQLTKEALLIEVIHKDALVKDREIGWCWVNLNELLYIPLSCNGDKQLHFVDEYYPIDQIKQGNWKHSKVECNGKLALSTIGHIRICCSLEDFGRIAHLDNGHNANVSTASLPVRESLLQHVPSHFPNEEKKEGTIAVCNTIYATAKLMEEQIVRELKLWKIEQQNKWHEKWKLIEAKKLSELEERWKEQENHRLQTIAKKKEELLKLEKKLKLSLYDIEGEERKIKLEQTRLEHMKSELESQFKTKQVLCDVDGKTKYEHEQRRCEELREELVKHKKQADASTHKYILNATYLNKKIGQLRMELASTCKELDQYKQQIDSMTHREKDLRIQLKESLKEVSRLQHKLHAKESEYIESEKKHVERLRIELFSKFCFISLYLLNTIFKHLIDLMFFYKRRQHLTDRSKKRNELVSITETLEQITSDDTKKNTVSNQMNHVE
ncbi:hypothetical protein RFI_13863, partial [Reticulomyxa filosa]